ncbi:hypothetical protein [Paenibacillus chungangensis]|uniref:Uncharacterized protein n=1 Tax=Paenibacillus chungangensis TaxID=696535 RepID=A0ABW3HQR3_9BACL
MNLYRLRVDGEDGEDRMKAYLEDHFISIGWSRLGDLAYAEDHEAIERLRHHYALEGNSLRTAVDAIRHFTTGMQDGDYVLVVHDNGIVLGDLGDYYYIDDPLSDESKLCHRRGVTWLKRMGKDELPPSLQAFVREDGEVGKFCRPISAAEAEQWRAVESASASEGTGKMPRVDEELVLEALAILKEAMRSAEPERRERAAIAILQYAQGCLKE